MSQTSSLGDLSSNIGIPAAAEAADIAFPAPTIQQHRLMQVVPVRAASVHGNAVAEALYRVFELAVALLMFLLALPVMVVEAVLIRLDTPGSPLFSQPRVARSAIMDGSDLMGQGGFRPPPGGLQPGVRYHVPQTFPFYKFRTMHHDAKQRFPELYAYRFEPDTFHRERFKVEQDPRVTPLGSILRRLTLDELPNLWCVLRGTMRLVGPRPELPELPCNYTAAEMYKFSVKPGITGLAQINGRGLLSWGETLAWDLHYVENRTVWLDLKILVVTAWFVVARRGAF